MSAFGKTDIGKQRTINQDFIFVSETPVGNLPNLYIVADGMGGHRAGDVASRMTVEQVVAYIKEGKELSPITLIDTAIARANKALVEKAKSSDDYEGMGTTIVVATVLPEAIYIANVGDSRFYLINDSIKQISRDHSLVEEMVSLGELKEENARQHQKKNIITRAIGAEEQVVPDFFEIEYEPGDKILMCSDGLTNMVEDIVIKHIVNDRDDVEEIVKLLIAQANENGGSDNVSVVVVQLDRTYKTGV